MCLISAVFCSQSVIGAPKIESVPASIGCTAYEVYVAGEVQKYRDEYCQSVFGPEARFRMLGNLPVCNLGGEP